MLFLSPFLPLGVHQYTYRGKNGDSASKCDSPFLFEEKFKKSTYGLIGLYDRYLYGRFPIAYNKSEIELQFIF